MVLNSGASFNNKVSSLTFQYSLTTALAVEMCSFCLFGFKILKLDPCHPLFSDMDSHACSIKIILFNTNSYLLNCNIYLQSTCSHIRTDQ